jgi:hypothetical protein
MMKDGLSTQWIKYATMARPHKKKIYIPISIVIGPGIHPHTVLSAKVIGRGVLIRPGPTLASQEVLSEEAAVTMLERKANPFRRPGVHAVSRSRPNTSQFSARSERRNVLQGREREGRSNILSLDWEIWDVGVLGGFG